MKPFPRLHCEAIIPSSGGNFCSFCSPFRCARPSARPGVDGAQWFKNWFANDFGMIGYYADDNAKLLASNTVVDVVFLGDSITEGWIEKQPQFFVPGRVDRGISGQTSSQMFFG